MLIAVIASLTGVACYFAFFRAPRASASGKAIARGTAVPDKKEPPAPSGDHMPAPIFYAPPPDDTADPMPAGEEGNLANPADVAPAAINLVALFQQDPDYVSPTAHSGLYSSLQALKRVAQDVANDDRSDPAFTADRQAELGYQIDVNIARTKVIINRQSESDSARQTTQQLQAMLMNMRTQ